MTTPRRETMPLDEPALTRAAFLRAMTSLALAAAVAPLPPFRAPAARAAGAPLPAVLPVVEIAPGVFVHQGHHGLFSPDNAGDISNCGFVVGRDAVAVIDTGGSAVVGRALKAAVRAATDRPIRYVVNTHMHPDHVFGNAAFADPGTAFVAHHKMGRGLAARAERYLAINSRLLGDTAFAGTRIVPPTTAVEGETALDLGGRRLILAPQRTAHTDNDLTVRDETTGTLFMGDLLFAEHIPTIDGSIKGWLAVIAALSSLDAARVVPGHGPPSMAWPAAAAALERYLGRLASGVRAAIKSGKTLGEAAATVGLEEKDAWLLFAEYHARNVSAAFAELEWE